VNLVKRRRLEVGRTHTDLFLWIFCFSSPDDSLLVVHHYLNDYLLTYPFQPSTCILLQASSKRSTMTRRNLKGSRKLQNFSFLGGITSGIATGGGTATGVGSAQTMNETGISTATTTGEFTTTSGASGFVDTIFGTAEGNAAGGATGSQLGAASAMLGVGLIKFDGTTSASGAGAFGAGFSPVAFNTITTEIPGSAIEASGGSSKGGGSAGGGVSDPTFITTVVPVSTGPTGGFGLGSGGLGILTSTTGTLLGNTTVGAGSSVGAATTFGGGMGTSTNYFGTAGGLGSGAGSGAAAAVGTTMLDVIGGTFITAGTATGAFNNQGIGIFGASARDSIIAFP
jgi:hypothetical protein